MADNWAEAVRQTDFQNNVTRELRQEPGILYPLAGTTMNYGQKATSARIETRFGQQSLQKKTERNGDTNNVDASLTNRFIKKPGSSNVAPLIDRDDMMATSIDLKSPLVVETAAAIKQYHDDQFLKGWWGPSYGGGEAQDTTIVFPSANKVAVNFGGVAVGLTLAKLIELRRQLQAGNVNFSRENPIILLDPDSVSDLFQINEYKSFDYNSSKPLVDGELKPWMGFRFLQANLKDPLAYPEGSAFFQTGGGTVNRLPVIIPSAIHRGVWVEAYTRLTERDDKQFSTQIYAEAESAVVRTDDKKTWFIETKPVS